MAKVNILANGLDYATGNPLIRSLDEEDFSNCIEGALVRNAGSIRTKQQQTTASRAYRGELAGQKTRNLADPREAGWTYLIHREDPKRKEVMAALESLARHRGMLDPSAPLVFDAGCDWTEWLMKNYASIPVRRRPYYILMVGGPDLLPFHFQALFDVAACVGRIAFDSVDQLSTYVEKLLRLETASSPATTADAFFFAPNYGLRADGSYDATYYSCEYMAKPLIEQVKHIDDFRVLPLLAQDATKRSLIKILKNARPALFYSAGHGMAAPHKSFDIQQQVNGAICCQRTGDEGKPEDYLFASRDVPDNGDPILEGAVVFQFACFGYGTPSTSDFANWDLDVPKKNSKVDFIAGLPKRLLAHPRGPISFIGHVDTAWLHGFDNPDDPFVKEAWNPRLEPFRTIVETLLKVQPPGLALNDLNDRYNLMNAKLTAMVDSMEGRQYKKSSAARRQLASDFITRSDAQNYMVMGDPAARLRVSVD